MSRHCSVGEYGARNGAKIAAAYIAARIARAAAPRLERSVWGRRFLQKNATAQHSPSASIRASTAAPAIAAQKKAVLRNAKNAGNVSHAHVRPAMAAAAQAVKTAIPFAGIFSRSRRMRGSARASSMSAISWPATSIAQPITTPAITTYWSCLIIAAYMSCPRPG